MSFISRSLQFFQEYRSVMLRFLMLILGLLIINFSQAQVGSVCSNPIKVLELPFLHSGDISTYGNNYYGGDVPDDINNPFNTEPYNPTYLNGSEVVYRYIPEVTGFVDVSFTSSELNSSVWVFADCPFAASVGWDYSTTGYSGEIIDLYLNSTEAYYFVLSSNNPSANYSFDFEIKTAVPGKKCEVPINIASLPYQHSGTPSDYGDDYGSTDLPAASPNAITNVTYDAVYLSGPEVVYAYTPATDGFIIAGAEAEGFYPSIFVLTGCPFQSLLGWDYSIVSGVNLVVNIPVVAGQTYYFVLSSASSVTSYTYTFFLEESQGLICDAPYEITEGFTLPFTVSGEVPVYGNDYDQSDVPPASAEAIHNVPYESFYLIGPEVVFEYTPTADGYMDASVSVDEDYASLWVFTGCPFESAIGWDYSETQEDNEIKNIPVTAGETYYFVLSGAQASVGYNYSFTLQKSQGAVCESPLQVQSLPFSHLGQISDYGNDYSASDIPPSVPVPTHTSPKLTFLLNGYDVVYTYTPDTDQTVDASVIGDGNYMGLWVFTGCPFELLHGWDMFITNEQLEINEIPLLAGVEYYFVVSTNSETAFDYTFELKEFDCPTLELNIGDPCFDGSYITTGDNVRENCECEGYSHNASFTFTITPPLGCGTRAFKVKSYVPNSDILIQSYSENSSLLNNVTINILPIGTVDMYIEIDGALRILLEDQVLTPENSTIEINNLVLGDLNASNSINLSDISIFGSCFGTTPNSSNYNHLANINCDSSINLIDFSLMGINFGMQGVSLP